MNKHDGAKVSINRRRSNVTGDYICITIEDSLSGSRVVEVSLTPAEFALAVTGLADQSANYEFKPNKHVVDVIGKKVEVKDVYCDNYEGDFTSRKAEQRRMVLEDLAKNHEGWELSNDCVYRQQWEDKHKYSIKRYVEPDSNEIVL